MRNVLIFDLGGVLEIHNSDSFCDWIKNKFSIKKDIKSIYKKLEYLRDIDKIDEHEFYKGFAKEIGISFSEKEFYDEYYKNHVFQCYDVLKLIKDELVGRYELFIFSNNSRINIRRFREKVDFEKLFKRCIYSFDLKTKKPDIEFFKNGLKIIGHEGNECFLIDDQLKSKENAESFGIKFIKYEGLDKLKRDLKAAKVIP